MTGKITPEILIADLLEDMRIPSEKMCSEGLRALSDNGVDASTEGASDADDPYNDALVCWQAMLEQYRKEALYRLFLITPPHKD